MDYSEIHRIATNLRDKVRSYALDNNTDFIIYMIADDFISNACHKAYLNEEYGTMFYNWMLRTNTIKLRELLSEIGCDYWNNINHQNACDLIDSV